MSSVLDRRRAGILLHITSLPGGVGNGDFGQDAYRFIDFLAEAGISVWQTLPLGQTHADGSPYQCLSVHAGNPLLINLEWLQARGWLNQTEKPESYEQASDYRYACIRAAYTGFQQDSDNAIKADYDAFVDAQSEWLDDYALYLALRQEFKEQHWLEWPESLRDRKAVALETTHKRLESTVNRVKFEQFVFFRQWHELKAYAHDKGVLLFGDMPIFVSDDSADVWANREYFDLNKDGRSRVVAGVPPDYFSETGQLWGNPHYNWERMQSDGFGWWIRRIRSQLELFDWVRIDHFRGLEAYWEIPADAETAIHGSWVKAPGEALLNAVHAAFGSIPLIAEDLGIITPEVEALRDRFDMPGMKILQFAFDGGPTNIYLPHNHCPNSVVYTGTHDNDTSLSWYESLSEEQKLHVVDYLGYGNKTMPWALVQSALASVSNLAVIPLQDVLGLGCGHRMNTPGTVGDNWHWRFSWKQLNDDTVSRLSHLVQLYGRTEN